MKILDIKNLYKSFDDKKVLNDINLDIEEGEALALIGPSGIGKSTLLRIIGGLEKADAGNMKIFDDDIMVNGVYKKNKYLKKIYEKISFIFQDFNLFDNMNVKKNVCIAPKFRKYQNIDSDFDELMKMMKLEGKENSYPSTLSGGEKQRVAIARALITKPNFILFDEPTSALDVESINNLVYTINEMKKKNITMMIVTHDLNFASKVASRIIFMDNAKVLDENNERVSDFMSLSKN